MDVALVDADISAYLVPWWDAPVGESIIIEGIRTHIDGEVKVLCPLSSGSRTHRDSELSAHILTGQFMPFLYIEIGPLAIDMQFASTAPADLHIHTVETCIGHIEVERSDVRRHRHPHIIGIYSGELADHLGIVGRIGACRQQGKEPGNDDEVWLSHVSFLPSFSSHTSRRPKSYRCHSTE